MLLYMEIPLILFFLGFFFRVYSLVLYKKNKENFRYNVGVDLVLDFQTIILYRILDGLGCDTPYYKR